MPPFRQIALQSPAGQWMADTSLSGARVARELDALVRVYGKPACIVSDNGTEFTSRAILKWAGDTITITSDHTHRWETKRPLKRGVRLDSLRVLRMMRLPKLTMKNMKSKPANSRYE